MTSTAAKKKVIYFDSSVLVSFVTQDPTRFKKIQRELTEDLIAVSSELSVAECQSGLCASYEPSSPELLAGWEQDLNRVLARLSLYEVNSLVIGQSRALLKKYRQSVGLRTLDAIHVSTLNLIASALSTSGGNYSLSYLTADKRQHAAFTAEGYIGSLI